MLRQQFCVKHYWEVIVYYDVDYGLFYAIVKELQDLGMNNRDIREIHYIMKRRKAKAVTYSNLNKRISTVLFNRHDSRVDYLNSIVHEAEHIKQAMLKAYKVKDSGEPPAYTIGYLISRMYEAFSKFI